MEAAAQSEVTQSLILLYPLAAGGNSYLQQLKATLQADHTARIAEPNSTKEITQLVQQHGKALMIFSIRHKEDLTLVLNALADLQSLIKRKALRVIGVNQLDNAKVLTFLMKRNCADVFPVTINPKALKHKIRQSLRILETYRSAQGLAPQAEEAPASGTEAAKKLPTPAEAAAAAEALQRETAAAAPAPRMRIQSELRKIAALALGSDCWLVRKEKDFRCVQGKWIVDLIGPGPSAGIWDERAGEEDVWVWTPKTGSTEIKDFVSGKEFLSDEGTWICRGSRRPEFVWELGRWRFLGTRIELVFENKGAVLATRFKVADGAMEYAANSPQAKAKLPLIVKSIENEVRFQNEKKAALGKDKNFRDDKKYERMADRALEDDALEGMLLDFEDEEKTTESKDLRVRLEKPKAADGGGGCTLGEIPEEIPFNQAPKPKLRIWLQPEGGKPAEAQPVEISDVELLLELPAQVFSATQVVSLIMDDGLMGPRSKSKVNATVKEVQPIESGAKTEMVCLQVDAGLKLLLEPLQKAFELRQDEIVEFMKAARGW